MNVMENLVDTLDTAMRAVVRCGVRTAMGYYLTEGNTTVFLSRRMDDMKVHWGDLDRPVIYVGPSGHYHRTADEAPSLMADLQEMAKIALS